MKNPFKRKSNVYTPERTRLLEWANSLDPTTPEYQNLMARIDELDKIHRRSNELTKVAIPALGTIGGVAGVYALQQFAGVIVPKALETIASRGNSHQK